MLKFVDSGSYFVQDENNFLNPLLQVGFGSGGQKINGSDRIRILLPAYMYMFEQFGIQTNFSRVYTDVMLHE